MKRLWLGFFGLVAITPQAIGQASDFPHRTVTIIVATTPGSSADSSARIYAQQFSEIFGKPFVVENKPGADGAIGVMAVKNAPADGYTILMGSNSPLSANPIVKKGLPYDPLKDLKPVGGIFKAMNAFVVAGDSKLNTLSDLVDTAKKSKAPLSIGTSFAGYRLDAKWFSGLAGVSFNDVPYNGTAQVVTDVMGNQLDFGFVDRSLVNPLVKAGKLKVLAVGGETRYPGFPDVATVRESGYPEFLSYAWIGFFVRAETPDDVVAKLASAMPKVAESEKMRAFMEKIGASPMPLGPEEMRKFHVAEIERYRRVAAASGITPQ
ncbi:MAG: tripartite tricarboxylate transporter substrate binding protein [Burkholderiaceae bacterium]|nr:tripartite tricarboxylate transporter substrate binding protein [Burkholderiaceae bacterium]